MMRLEYKAGDNSNAEYDSKTPVKIAQVVDDGQLRTSMSPMNPEVQTPIENAPIQGLDLDK
jgi:hypothetical protein